MLNKHKIVYILPFYDAETPTHLFYNYELTREVRRRGMDILVLDARALGFLKLFLKLLRARFQGYKNCYVHYSFYGALAALFSRYEVFYWNRGLPWLFQRKFLEEQIFRFILRHSILVTSPESLAKEYQKRYGVREYKILSNWIDVERFRPKDDKKPEPKIILFVHHLSERKGADLIPEIAKAFQNEAVEFGVIGEGPYLEKLKNQNVKIKILGGIPNKDMVPYFQKAYIYLMPSREEGSPHTLLDAMAAGTPFVASDVGGVREIVPPGMTEFLCPSEDIICFQKKIRKFLADERLYEKARTEGLNYAKNFDISRGVTEFIGLFEEKLKIFYVANARMPTEKAHGIQLAKMCEAFVAQGADLELVLPQKKNSIRQSIEEFYGLKHKIRIKKLPVLDLGFRISALSFALSYFLYLFFKQGVIYTIDLDYFSFFLIPFLGKPYFMEVHGEKRPSFPHRLIFQGLAGAIAINRYVKEVLMKNFGLPSEKVSVFPNGMDLELFSSFSKNEARRKLGLEEKVKLVIHTGQFYDWKGLEIFSETAARLPAVQFYLVGGAEEEFKKLTGFAALPPNLIFKGMAPFHEIPFWLSAADALVAPGTKKNSYSYFYTSPMKLLEYLAARRPIAAADTPAIRELVSENEVFFYEPDDTRDLADKIKYLLENPAEGEKKARAAYQRARDFTWEKRAKKIIEFMKHE